jgi:hypothetical protein
MNRIFKLAAFLVLAITALIAFTPTMPTFYARRDYQEPGNDQIQVADVNNDRIPDIVIDASGSIVVMLGNGDGTFQSGLSSKTALFTNINFALADLEGDGTLDLVTAGGIYTGQVTSGIAVSQGNGNGTFQTGTFYPVGTGDGLSSVVIGDFNGDGISDAMAIGNGGAWLFTGKGGGVFNPGVMTVALSSQPLAMVAADLNGDNKLDLVITLNGPGFVVLFGNGNGTFQTPVSFSQPGRAASLAVGSLTKGGPPGIVLTGPNDTFVYYGNGAGKFTGPSTLPGSGGGVAIGDVNGDGIPDIVSSAIYIYFGLGAGKFSNATYYPMWGAGTLTSAIGIALADLRNNGLTDIITDGGGISVLLSQGKGVFEDGIWTKVSGGAGCSVKGDFNHDGKPDLAVVNSNGISILLGTGKYATPFTTGTSIALSGAGCLIDADVNADGNLDLLVPVNGTVETYLGNGDGTFSLKSTTPTPSGGELAVGDFNHDGKTDFATSGNLIALGNGDGTFQNPTGVVADPPAGGFSGVAAGDINNDGWTDLVFTSDVFPVDANITVLLNNHKGNFTAVSANFGGLTINPILADLNGDGNLDLVLLGTASGDAAVALGNGEGGFTFSRYLAGPIIDTPGSIAVADVNGDGIPDILMSGSDTLLIYLGESGSAYAAPFGVGTGPSPGSLLVENLHGQSPKKGLPDIVIPDTSGGVEVLFNTTP